MGKKFYPSDVVEQAQDVLVGWAQANPALSFGTLNSAALAADVTASAPLEEEILALEKQLADKRDQRNMLYHAMWDKIKPIRSGFKASYGDDSQKYELVGGTRLSDRKSPRRYAPPVQ